MLFRSVEEALIDMYLAGVSTRQVDDISRLLWGERMPSQTLSDKLKKVYEDIDRWRNRPLTDRSYRLCPKSCANVVPPVRGAVISSLP